MPSVTSAPGTLVKFRDITGAQRIGIVRTATHIPSLPTSPNQTKIAHTVLAASATTTNNTRSCKQMAEVLQPTTKAHEWHHREQAITPTHNCPTMSKKYIRSYTNTRWRNLTDSNKKLYLKQQTDDGAAKAQIFANNKLTNEQRKSTQYIFNFDTPYDTHTYFSLLILSAHRQTTTAAPAHLELTAPPSQQLQTVMTNSSLTPCLPL